MRQRPLVVGRSRSGRPVDLSDPKIRQYHLHVLGQFGLGKSTLLEHMLRTDIFNRQGVCLIDPHGSLYDDLLRWLTETGLVTSRPILLLEPGSPLWSFAFNPIDFTGFTSEQRGMAVDATVQALSSVWGDQNFDHTPRMARLLYDVLHAISEKRLTLHEALDLCLPSSPLRQHLTGGLSNAIVQAEWDDLNTTPPRQYGELFESTRNRLQRFLQDERMAAIVGQTERTLDLLKIMDEGAVLLVNLAGFGEEHKKLLGSLLVSNFVHTALHRRKANASRPFHLYIDECYDFLNKQVGTAITGCRKFGLHLTLSHQNLGQLREASPAVYSAVMQIPNRIVFGGLPVEEAAELADSLFMDTYDVNRTKDVLNKPVVVRYVKEYLEHYSQTSGRFSGSSSSVSSGSSFGSGTGTSRLYDEDGTEIPGYGAFDSESESYSSSESSSTSAGESEAESSGWSETYRPILEERPTATVSLEEQRHEATVRVRGQLQRQAIVKLFGKPPIHALTPFVRPAIARDERVEAAKLAVFERTAFALPRADAQRAIAARREQLKLAAIAQEPDSYRE